MIHPIPFDTTHGRLQCGCTSIPTTGLWVKLNDLRSQRSPRRSRAELVDSSVTTTHQCTSRGRMGPGSGFSLGSESPTTVSSGAFCGTRECFRGFKTGHSDDSYIL